MSRSELSRNTPWTESTGNVEIGLLHVRAHSTEPVVGQFTVRGFFVAVELGAEEAGVDFTAACDGFAE